MSGEKILVTGVAGFIGYHFARRLLHEGFRVIGVDSVNDYYDPRLKYARLRELGLTGEETNALERGKTARVEKPGLVFLKMDLREKEGVAELFARELPDRVVHLAAQAGVRYSLENPLAYMESNLIAFTHILEGCRHFQVKHLVFASSSSVYGSNRDYPFSERHNVDHPVSLYAATKKANELMAHAYAHLFSIPVTGLRFFTVYGPWGRPDMALFLFTERILNGRPIEVFNEGRMKRDFTYIDDIVEGMLRVMKKIPRPDPDWNGTDPDPATSSAPYRIFNIGNNTPIELLSFIGQIEDKLGKSAKMNLLPLQPGDVPETAADIDALREYAGFVPSTPLAEGISRFIDWYRSYYEKT